MLQYILLFFIITIFFFLGVIFSCLIVVNGNEHSQSRKIKKIRRNETATKQPKHSKNEEKEIDIKEKLSSKTSNLRKIDKSASFAEFNCECDNENLNEHIKRKMKQQDKKYGKRKKC